MTPTSNHPDHDNEGLARLRNEIEQVDRNMIKLIARRVELARRVGAVKHTAGLPAFDADREAAVIRRVSAVAREEGAPEEEVRYLFRYIIGMSRRVQLIDE
ncbi:MAG: chorismate mutase [Gemmatimonadaceae bacterium]